MKASGAWKLIKHLELSYNFFSHFYSFIIPAVLYDIHTSYWDFESGIVIKKQVIVIVVIFFCSTSLFTCETEWKGKPDFE